jgi:hypothetical protein
MFDRTDIGEEQVVPVRLTLDVRERRQFSERIDGRRLAMRGRDASSGGAADLGTRKR